MTIRDIIVFLFKWKASIIGVFLAVVTAVTALVYILPPSYAGKASVLVERNRSPVMRLNFAPGTDMIEVMTTESELILSRTVMADVVEKLNLHERTGKNSIFKQAVTGIRSTMVGWGLIGAAPPKEKWIDSLQHNVVAKPVVNSNVIDISYMDEDPQWAAKIVNAVIESYISNHMRVYNPLEGRDLYGQQLAAAEQRLEELRHRLAQVKRHASFSALEDSKREAVRTLSVLGEQLSNAQTEQAELLVRFEPDHEQVKQVKAKIARINSSISTTSHQIKLMEQDEAKVKEIELAYSAEERTYRDYKQRYDEAQLGEAGGVNLTNIRVVDYADVPSTPRHSRLFFIAVAVGGGLFLSLGVAFLREYFDRRILDPRAIEQILGVPELGSIQRFKNTPYG